MLLRSTKTYYKKNQFFNIFAISEVNIIAILAVIGLCLTSLICLLSANNGSENNWIHKQIIFIFISIPVFITIISVNIKVIQKLAYYILFGSILLLIYVMLFGKKSMGAVRWINLGIFTFQPSEIAKISTVLTLAKYFSQFPRTIEKWYATFAPIALISPIALLVMIQPDLATSIVIIFTTITILFAIGIPIWQFILSGTITLAVIPFLWIKMKTYQKLRIINFLNPENDPLGSGYNVIQSKIAIGSGGLFGQGMLNGTQGQLKFLPEHHTDFIFTIIGEEFGFIGCISVICLYLYLMWYGFNVTVNARDIFSKVVACGCTTILFIHIFVNIGMTTGLMPVAGIPLPFISYGGTMMIVSFICIALITNVDIYNKN
jgi:rod shape determining protein RodA